MNIGYSADMSDSVGDPFDAKMFVARCDACGGLVVYDDNGGVLADADFMEAMRVYPEDICLHESIPLKIRQAYTKAARVMWIDPDAFGLLIRRAIEMICAEEDIRGGSLEAKLRQLQKKRNLPSEIAEVAMRLRLLGNRAAHDTEKGLHPLHVHGIDDFFKVLLDYLYILPFRLEYAKQFEK